MRGLTTGLLSRSRILAYDKVLFVCCDAEDNAVYVVNCADWVGWGVQAGWLPVGLQF